MMHHREHPHGVMFHRFHDDQMKYIGQGSLSGDNFEDIINYIGTERILSPNEWQDKLKTNTLNNSDICLTFDDGLKSQILIALPILKKYNLKAFFFIHSLTFFDEVDYNEVFNVIIRSEFPNIDIFLDQFLIFNKLNKNIFETKKFYKYKNYLNKNYVFYTEGDIKYRYLRNNIFTKPDVFNSILKKFFRSNNISIEKVSENLWLDNKDIDQINIDGHTIGMHSFSHYINFCDLNIDIQTREYKENKDHLESFIDYKITSMSHPLGSYNTKCLELLEELDITCGFRSDDSIPDKIDSTNIINPTTLEIARVDAVNILKDLETSNK